MYERELAVAVKAVAQASRLCRAVQGAIGSGVATKSDKSPVTVADFGSQAIVCRALAEAFPADPVIAEEGAADLRTGEAIALRDRVTAQVRAVVGDCSETQVLEWIDRGGSREASARFWTLDPIDGTKGFLRGEQYAVSLALIVAGKLAVAALACPNLPHESGTGVVFSAVAGAGAFGVALDALHSSPRPVRVSPQASPAAARLCESVESGHSAHDVSAQVIAALGAGGTPVRMDSQAKYGEVARGGAEVYLRLPTRADYREKIWDHAAGALVVIEAGGRVTDIRGNELDFGRGPELAAGAGVIATNGRLHDTVLTAVAACG